MPLALIIVVFAGLPFSVGTEVILEGSLNFDEFEDKTDYCNDEGEVWYGIMLARKDECEDDDCFCRERRKLFPSACTDAGPVHCCRSCRMTSIV